MLIFGPVPEFITLTSTFIMLFQVSFGNWDFTIFDKLGEEYNLTYMYLGKVYLIVYILFNAVVFVNLMVALLTNTHSSYALIVKGLYSNNINQIANTYKHDSYYGGLISATPPFNFFMIFLLPFYLKKPNEVLRTTNLMVMKIVYFPLFFFQFFIFGLVNLVMMPFAYFKTLIHKCLIYKRKKKI